MRGIQLKLWELINMASSFQQSFVEWSKELFKNILASLNCSVQYKITLLALCVEESLRNVLISFEILLASRLKRSLKDTANPICNQLLASLYKPSSTQALAPEKERIIVGTKYSSLLKYKRTDKMDLISHLAGNKNFDNEGNLNL